MNLIIDVREKLLIESVKYLKSSDKKFADIEFETKNLDLGDIIIKDKEGNDILIVERKTTQDLISSIKDGRYNEQSYRLNGIEHHNHNIIYLIEGNIKGLSSDKQMVYSSIFSINYYKGFSVYRSDNVQESAYILLNMCLKLNKEKDKKPFYSLSTNETETEDKEEKKYCSVIKKKKNSNITPENFGEIVLCQIPSISSVTAIAIMEEFKTINNLIEKIKENPECLNDITYLSKDKKRKISKTCIKNILEFLNN